MRRQQIEVSLPPERGFELESESHVIAMWLFLDQHDQRSFAVGFVERVIDGLEVAAAEDAPHVEIDRFGIKRLADARLHRLQHDRLIDAARAFDPDRIDGLRLSDRRYHLLCAHRRILFGRQR